MFSLPFALNRYYSSTPRPSLSADLPLERVPHITILRPIKGIEPCLYECLAATFGQTYPKSKLTIYLCIASRSDPAYPIVKQLLDDFPTFDAKLLVEEEDPNLSGRDGKIQNLGPNPKIRNMSRGYREAKGDIMWIIDCNVWIGPGVAGRMVDLLCGFTPASSGTKYKFVHQLPLVVDISDTSVSSSLKPPNGNSSELKPSFSHIGGLLEELFLSTSHAKFYTAISRVAVAPCTVGKSNMFRRSHLNTLTTGTPLRSPGIDSFSDNICEDHLIGDLLWRSPVPESVMISAEDEGKPPGTPQNRTFSGNISPSKWRNHALLSSDLAIQPTFYLSLSDYLARRVRWLRVRKFTVTLATLVEPGTESLLCTLYFAFGATRSPFFTQVLHLPATWSMFCVLWVLGVLAWMGVDYLVWRRLQRGSTVEGKGPRFLAGRRRRGKGEWALGWMGREGLAFAIWVWAVVGGVTVVWRGRRFWVGVDMRVHDCVVTSACVSIFSGVWPSLGVGRCLDSFPACTATIRM